MGLITSIIKYLVLVFILCFGIAGQVLIGFGMHYKYRILDMLELMGSKQTYLAETSSLLVYVGCATFVLSFFGLWATVSESPCALTMYGILLGAMFTAQLGIGVTALRHKEDKDGKIQSTLATDLKKQWDAGNKNKTLEPWFSYRCIEIHLRCCGIKGPSDYSGNKPVSCCTAPFLDCTPKNAFLNGCERRVWWHFQYGLGKIAEVAIYVGALQLIGAGLAIVLATCIRLLGRRDSY